MSKPIFIVMFLALQGCVASNQLTMPTGKWQMINQENFIPPKAQTTFALIDNDNTKAEKKAKTEADEINLDFLWGKD